jgi:formylglycine-generating enzyme required for sulfatase activity
VDLVRTALEKDPSKRFGSMQPVVAALQSAISQDFLTRNLLGLEPVKPQDGAREPAIGKKIAAVAVVVTLALMAGIVSYFVAHREPRQYAAELRLPSGDMVLVPAGPAIVGPNAATHVLPAFYIDKTEVSNAAWAKFCHCTPAGAAEEPVVNVSVEDAFRFAKWAGKRLPTEDEWEKAARGPNGLAYPWGNVADATRANVKDNPDAPHRLMPVASFEEGKSPYGVLNMMGNAWEWTSTTVQPQRQILELAKQDTSISPPLRDGEPWYAVKGGSYLRPLISADPQDEPVPIYEAAATPGRIKAPDIGFRCAKDVQ